MRINAAGFLGETEKFNITGQIIPLYTHTPDEQHVLCRFFYFVGTYLNVSWFSARINIYIYIKSTAKQVPKFYISSEKFGVTGGKVEWNVNLNFIP